MNRYRTTVLVVLCSLVVITCNGFTLLPTISSSTTTTTKKFNYNIANSVLYSLRDDEDTTTSVIRVSIKNDLRPWLVQSIWSTLMVTSIITTTTTILLIAPQSVSASYSAYAHREEDWQQRISSNTVQVSSPKVLRDQLRQIAPMNEERSRIFCPNGPSAAVTPLMENRCSDLRQATPSVFGRSDDVVGNSIPGFSKEWTSSIYNSAADPGGLPEYGFTKSNRK